MSVNEPMYRKLPVTLTPEERLARADKAAKLSSEYCSLESDNKARSADARGRLKDLRFERETLEEAVRSGRELQLREIEERKNYARLTMEIYRLDTGELVESRPLTLEERQEHLTGIDGGAEERSPRPPRSKRAKADDDEGN